MGARIVELIYTDDDMAGEGIDNSPYRRLQKLYSKDGILIASLDPCGKKNDEGDYEEEMYFSGRNL